MTPEAGVPPLRSEPGRRRQLAVARRRATALLGATTAVFLAVTLFGSHATWAGYLQAAAEASMVGGLADWFAVVALFRHPLGLPIPHTAVVVERKDQFAVTLGEFIQESFLTPDAIIDRLRTADVLGRASQWLADPDRVSRVTGDVADAIVAVLDLLHDDDVHTALERIVREQVDAVPLAPVAGRVLQFVTEDGRHDKVLDVALTGLDQYLERHHDELRERLGWHVPWWVPLAVEDRIYERLFEAARDALRGMAGDPEHPLRKELEGRLRQLAAELLRSPEMRARGEQMKQDLLSQPQLRDWVATLWQEAKERLRASAADPESELRQSLETAIRELGRHLRDDATFRAAAQNWLESLVGYVARHFDTEVSSLVSGTIARWDADETARRLELLLGPDLQYIRINGTIVGALAGVILHAVAQGLA
ncbi:MAG: DUF445 domain-containing protein [Actinobacteria bacterium]|nr:DUF445 domain-containing protein [Actinomycetota bacterium]